MDLLSRNARINVSPGRYHAAHLTNDGDYEELAREAGKVSGDMTFPLVYTPELHFCEFESAVADMKNSVKVLFRHFFFQAFKNCFVKNSSNLAYLAET